MAKKVAFDSSTARKFLSGNELQMVEAIAEAAKTTLITGSGAGNDFLGWINLPVDYDKEEFSRIKKAADRKSVV